MSAAELLDSLDRAGAKLEIVDDKARIRGARIPAELLHALRNNRAELLEEFQRRKAEDRDRYGQVPPMDAPMLASELELPELSKQKIMVHVLRQPRPLHAWVMARANCYFEQGSKADDCEWRACVDVIAWQRRSAASEAVQFVVDLTLS